VRFVGPMPPRYRASLSIAISFNLWLT